MALIDYTTVTTCDPVAVPNRPAHSVYTSSCRTGIDGFYIVSTLSVMAGFVLFAFYLRPAIHLLQRAPLSAWKLP